MTGNFPFIVRNELIKTSLLVLATDHVWHPYVIRCKTHWLKIFLLRFMGKCLSEKTSLYFPKNDPSRLLLFSKLLAWCCFSWLLFVPDI